MAENTAKSPSIQDLMQNPKSLAMKKFLAAMLGQKYLDHEDLIHRVTYHLITDKDMEEFAKMMNEIYELGYFKAVADYKDQLMKLGVKVNISQKTLADSQKS